MSLDDLADTPPTPPPLPPSVAEYLMYLRELVNTPEVYGFALATLTGIGDTIAASRRVTPAQQQAVANIVAGAEDAHDRRRPTGRRYEGWSR